MQDGIPIRQLAELTGVAPATLRAWERRYGLMRPARTPKGHRSYSQADIELVRAVVSLLHDGIGIGEAARRVLRGDSARETGETPAQAAVAEPWALLQKRLLRAIEDFDAPRLESVYNEALSLYPGDLVSENLLRPALSELGGRWEKRATGVAEEHFFSAYLRNKIGARLHHEALRKYGARLLVACMPGEYHELGALLFSLHALGRGYRVVYLGADCPFEAVLSAARKLDVAAIVFSGTACSLSEDPHAQGELLRASGHTWMLGGSFSTRHTDWIQQYGGIALGTDQSLALERMLDLVPPYMKQ